MVKWDPDKNGGGNTIVAWFKPLNVPPTSLQSIFSDNWGPEMGLWLYGNGKAHGVAYFNIPSINIISTDWHHAAVIFTKQLEVEGSFYLDGIKQGDGTARIGNGLRDRPYVLGGDYAGGTPAKYFKGIIDDVKVYNKALSESEVKQLANGYDYSIQLTVNVE